MRGVRVEGWETGKVYGGQEDIKGSLVLSQYLLRDDDHREALVIFCANPQDIWGPKRGENIWMTAVPWRTFNRGGSPTMIDKSADRLGVCIGRIHVFYGAF